MNERQTIIEAKLQEGALPCWRHTQLYAGYGHDERCDACGKVIAKREIEYEVIPYPKDSAFLRMHMDCFTIWTELCELESTAASG